MLLPHPIRQPARNRKFAFAVTGRVGYRQSEHFKIILSCLISRLELGIVL